MIYAIFMYAIGIFILHKTEVRRSFGDNDSLNRLFSCNLSGLIDWLKIKKFEHMLYFFFSQKWYLKKAVSWWQSHGIDIWPSSNNTTLPIIWRRSPFVGDATISGWNFAHSSVSLVTEFLWLWVLKSKIFGHKST